MPVLAPPRASDVGFGHHDDPPDAGGPHGGGRGWVVLTRANNDIEAHLLMGRLTQAGIECNSVKERGASASWVHGGSDPWAPVAIMVRGHQLDDARIVLAEVAMEAPPAAPSGHHVPGDRSWKGPLLWWVLALGLGVLLSALSYAGTAAEVERCRRDPVCAADL